MALPEGLALRTARPDDAVQVQRLLAERGEPVDAVDHRLVVEDPDAGWESCAVVVDGERVVSTALLLDETLRVGDVVLSAGQVELVATHPEHEGRGLVRALMEWAHRRSAERGHVVQVMVGIPYFYRLFGYAYAMDVPPVRPLGTRPEVPAGHVVRRATVSDVPAMAALQDATQAAADVAMPHSSPRWRWLLERDSGALWVVERAGEVVATGRTTEPDEGVVLTEVAAQDDGAARALLGGVAASIGGDAEVLIADRPGPVADAAFGASLPAPASELAEQYYVRIPDEVVLLDRLRPLLSGRLLASGLDRAGRDVVLSLFGRSYRMAVGPDGLGPVRAGGPMQAPGSVRGAGIAPDALADVLLGPHGLRGLSRVRPDVYPGPDVELFEALFPPLRADLLTFYLPY